MHELKPKEVYFRIYYTSGKNKYEGYKQTASAKIALKTARAIKDKGYNPIVEHKVLSYPPNCLGKIDSKKITISELEKMIV